jgi:hypothetical protein
MSQYSSAHHLISKLKHRLKPEHFSTKYKGRANTEERSINYSFLKKELNSTFSQCVSVDLIIEHGKTKRRITCILYSVYCLKLQENSHYLITCTSFKRTLLILRYLFRISIQNTNVRLPRENEVRH